MSNQPSRLRFLQEAAAHQYEQARKYADLAQWATDLAMRNPGITIGLDDPEVTIRYSTARAKLHQQAAADYSADARKLYNSLSYVPPAPLTTCNCRWQGDKQVQHCELHAAHLAAIHEWAQRAKMQTPIDMVLHCPRCHLQHIDAPELGHMGQPGLPDDAPPWSNPPHRSHLCKGCGLIWRPADVPTNGVQAIKTRGKHDSA